MWKTHSCDDKTFIFKARAKAAIHRIVCVSFTSFTDQYLLECLKSNCYKVYVIWRRWDLRLLKFMLVDWKVLQLWFRRVGIVTVTRTFQGLDHKDRDLKLVLKERTYIPANLPLRPHRIRLKQYVLQKCAKCYYFISFSTFNSVKMHTCSATELCVNSLKLRTQSQEKVQSVGQIG